jgi:transcriptional regulator with XRE-family HTH domain
VTREMVKRGRRKATGAREAQKDAVRLRGADLKKLRQEKGLDQLALALRVKCAKRTVQNAESGRPVRVYIARAIAEALGAPYAELLAVEDRLRLDIEAAPEIVGHLYSFETFIEERADGFVGRKSVFRKLDAFLRANPSGYFVIRGVPGSGKSALIAKLVKDRGYLHHFNVALQGINTAEQFLENVCAQLIVRYRLPYDRLPQAARTNGRFLNRLLKEASTLLAACGQETNRLILAVDGIDEVSRRDMPGGANVLYLPPILPRGTFVVVTTKPTERVRLQVSNYQALDLDVLSQDNLADVRAYVGRCLRHTAVQAFRQRSKYGTNESFVQAVMEKSEGCFLYVRRLLQAIRVGSYQDPTLSTLPEGLLPYYRDHWAMMRGGDRARFERVYRPLASALANAKGHVSAAYLAEQTKLDGQRVQRALRKWRPFLKQELDDVSGEPVYRIYHRSFQHFIRDEVGPG